MTVVRSWKKRGTIAHCRNRGCGRYLFSMQQTIAHACREVYCEKHTLPHATYKGRAWGAYTMIPKYAWAIMYRVPYWISKLPHFYFKTTFNTLIHWESSQLMGISTSSNSRCKIKHYFRQQYFLSDILIVLINQTTIRDNVHCAFVGTHHGSLSLIVVWYISKSLIQVVCAYALNKRIMCIALAQSHLLAPPF